MSKTTTPYGPDVRVSSFGTDIVMANILHSSVIQSDGVSSLHTLHDLVRGIKTPNTDKEHELLYVYNNAYRLITFLKTDPEYVKLNNTCMEAHALFIKHIAGDENPAIDGSVSLVEMMKWVDILDKAKQAIGDAVVLVQATSKKHDLYMGIEIDNSNPEYQRLLDMVVYQHNQSDNE